MNGICNLLVDLAQHPEVQDDIRADPDQVRAVVEESLRFRAPVHLFFRTVTKPTRVAGTDMAPGDKVAVVYAAANRDESKFPEPDVFDPHREDLGHVAFGFGIHRCVGALLAQIELRLVASAMLAHGAFVLTAEPTPQPLEGGHHMGWQEVNLRFSK